MEIRAVGYGRNLEGAELAAFQTWLDTRLPAHLPPTTVENRLATAAIRLFWGDRSATSQFVDLYADNPGSLIGRFPRLTATSVVRLLDKLPGDAARLAFRGLARRSQDRQRITEGGVSRFDESHHLDAAILECLSRLWNRPDLNPIENGSVAENLEERKRLARELLG